MNEVKPYVIGVDLGGTNTVFGIVNQRGDVLYDDSIRTQEYLTAEAFVEAGVACLKPLIEKAGETATTTQAPSSLHQISLGRALCHFQRCSAMLWAFLLL